MAAKKEAEKGDTFSCLQGNFPGAKNTLATFQLDVFGHTTNVFPMIGGIDGFLPLAAIEFAGPQKDDLSLRGNQGGNLFPVRSMQSPFPTNHIDGW